MMKSMLLGLSFGLCACRMAAAAPVVAPDAKNISLGINASLHGVRVLKAGAAWNTPIDKEPVDEKSAQMLAGIGNDLPLHPDFGTEYKGAPWGIPYIVVSGDTPRVPVLLDYLEESDRGPYPIPAPADVQIEGHARGDIPDGEASDQHLLLIDRDHAKIYELYLLHKNAQWHAASGAIFDLFGNTQRPVGWTSADAAGLPIFPGLARFDEVENGKIEHALRFTTNNTRKAYVAPATHWASKKGDPSLPPMGARLRLKASVDISGFPPQAQVILRALQRYGMILADNGGPMFLSGAPNPGWHDNEIETLKKLHARDFEVVKLGRVTTP